MSLNYKPIDTDFRSYYDTDSIKRSFKVIKDAEKRMAKQMLNSAYGLSVNMSELTPAQQDVIRDVFRYGKTHVASTYGAMEKENDMRIKDFIVLHADGQPVMVKKEAITVVVRMSVGTTRIEVDNQVWITDDKYEDVIKRLFEV